MKKIIAGLCLLTATFSHSTGKSIQIKNETGMKIKISLFQINVDPNLEDLEAIVHPGDQREIALPETTNYTHLAASTSMNPRQAGYHALYQLTSSEQIDFTIFRKGNGIGLRPTSSHE